MSAEIIDFASRRFPLYHCDVSTVVTEPINSERCREGMERTIAQFQRWADGTEEPPPIVPRGCDPDAYPPLAALSRWPFRDDS